METEEEQNNLLIMETKTQKINFLTTAIADAQELIRFIDTKTAIIITIIGAYVVGAFSAVDIIVAYWYKFSICFWIVLIAYIVLLIFSIIITTRIIKPTNMPTENIDFEDLAKPDLPFFIAPNKYNCKILIPFKNSSNYKLEISYKDFKSKINASDIDVIINSLSLELLKVSFIRNIKNDRFNILLFSLLITTLLFLVFYVLFSYESQLIISELEKSKTSCCK